MTQQGYGNWKPSEIRACCRSLTTFSGLSLGVGLQTEAGFPAADEISLVDSADPDRTTQVEYALKIDGTLVTPSQNGGAEWNLNSTGKFVFDQRRFPSDATGPFILRAVRRFATAETESIVGKDHKTSVALPQQASLIQSVRRGTSTAATKSSMCDSRDRKWICCRFPVTRSWQRDCFQHGI